ncbi:hypothetical protein [Halosimplex pelagicum]|uniref:Uncharacterized protein n=1 Tax=Halosimplex pelagicum TaxID=869886 RepID=A0A7D5PDS2_9EURY|nr:hypothetical protein [Halosimplex pelagicum]QLH83878.1 hypothetical protein HZS54_20580 [Halosimplex pelagicum]
MGTGTGRTTTGAEPLWIVGVGGVDRATLETVAEGAAETIPVDARIHPGDVPLSGFDGTHAEGLYHGLELADYARDRSGRDRVLAVTDETIVKPRVERAFGLAWRHGSKAIVSTADLGDRGDPAFEDRLRTVTSQHVGYLVGMDACDDETCLFHVADDAREFDRIGPDPCESCREELLGRSSPLVPDGDWSLDGGAVSGPSERGGGTGESSPLEVVALGDPDDAAVEAAVDAVETHLPFDATVASEPVALSALPDDAYDDAREQYDAVAVLDALDGAVGTEPTLAVTDADLFANRRNYVFGVGGIGGSTALFSTFRLAEDADIPASEADRDRETRVRKQAVTQAGRLLGAEKCSDKRCPFSSSPTVRELDIADEAPCDDCAATLAGRSWPVPDEVIRSDDDGGDSGRAETGSDTDGGGPERDPDPEPPGEQSRVDYLWKSLVHDLTNTAQFTGFVVGFGVSLFVAFVALGTALEAVAGPIDGQSAQVIWLLFAVSLLAAWYLYKLLKWGVLSLGRAAVGGLRSATE